MKKWTFRNNKKYLFIRCTLAKGLVSLWLHFDHIDFDLFLFKSAVDLGET